MSRMDPEAREAYSGTAAVTVATRGAFPWIIWRQKLSAQGSSVPGLTAPSGKARRRICRSPSTRVTTQTSHPRYPCRNRRTPSAADIQFVHGATSATVAGTTSASIRVRPSGNSRVGSAGAGEPVVVPAVSGALGGFLLRLGLQYARLARDRARGVAVGLPVDLLGAARQLLGLGPHLVEDAHAVILPQVGAPVSHRGTGRFRTVSLPRTAAARPPPPRVPAPTRGRGWWFHRPGTSRR